jgi:hypothetical protein
MNQTAVLHVAATAAIGGGAFVGDRTLTIGLFLLGAALFVAGIVVARRGD